MIVPTHTPEEVWREARRDMPALWNKMKGQMGRVWRTLRLNKDLRKVPQLFEYRSPKGNNWLVAMWLTKKVVHVAPFVWYRGADGLYRAARIVEDGPSYHLSHHLLQRYGERFNSTADALVRLKEFVRENMVFVAESARNANAVRVGVTQGCLFGHWLVPDQLAQLTTFVDHGRLYAEQRAQMERLDVVRAESLRSIRLPGEVQPWDMPRRA